MPKRQSESKQQFVAYAMFAVSADSLAEAQELAEDAGGGAPVIVVAESLRELPHPVHLASANLAFGMIGLGGKEERPDG